MRLALATSSHIRTHTPQLAASFFRSTQTPEHELVPPVHFCSSWRERDMALKLPSGGCTVRVSGAPVAHDVYGQADCKLLSM
jgi:hypothetical protein